jgi:hypothetical protein
MEADYKSTPAAGEQLIEARFSPSDWKPFSGCGHRQPMPFGQGYFTLGSTKAEVQAVQGSPTTSTDTAWQYGSSTVHFRIDRVVGCPVHRRSP